MRRMLALSGCLLGVDQITKTAAQLVLQSRELLLTPGWGVTYVANRGFWVWPEAQMGGVVAAHAAVFVLCVLPLRFALWYRRCYRASLLMDLFVAFFTLAAFGNLLDRLLVGGARDWLISPIAAANLADLAVWPALVLLGLEFGCHPPARRLLSLDPRRWWLPPAGDSGEG